jgi:alpha-beta hydrolase superfamily lysophospholipase
MGKTCPRDPGSAGWVWGSALPAIIAKSMKHPLPPRPELGSREGLAYALFLPEEEPRAGVVICHGSGSAKESHFDFARNAMAHGMAALAFDARGHGRSQGDFGPSAFDDAVAMLDLMREHAPAVALRGSSMGGFCAIHAAALDGRVAAVVAICPAPADYLLRGLRNDRLDGFDVDREATEPWLETLDIRGAVASLSDAGTALLLMHAQGDEQVPYTISEELHAVAGEPKQLFVVPGGHHRSLQHDLEMQAASIRFIERAAARRADAR